jgi:hypothetical protein
MNSNANQLTIPVRKALLFLSLPLSFVLIMHFFPQSVSWTIDQRFDLNSEANIPTWYSTILLFMVSCLSLIIFAVKDPSLPSRKFWLVMSAAYCFLSADESAMIHEAVAQYIKWMYIYAVVAAAFLVYSIRNLSKYHDATVRNWILGGMIVYGTGALGLETIWYIFKPLPPLLQEAEVFVEEGFEMAGTTIVLIGCLHEWNRVWAHLMQTVTGVGRFEAPQRSTAPLDHSA